MDGPARDSVSVVDLLQANARGHDDLLHRGRVLERLVGIEVQRLDEDTATTAGQSRRHERARVVTGEQPGRCGTASTPSDGGAPADASTPRDAAEFARSTAATRTAERSPPLPE